MQIRECECHAPACKPSMPRQLKAAASTARATMRSPVREPMAPLACRTQSGAGNSQSKLLQRGFMSSPSPPPPPPSPSTPSLSPFPFLS